jgi:two-component sensor histidine kinase
MFQAVIVFLFLNQHVYSETGNNSAIKPDSIVINKIIALNDSGVYYWRKKEFSQALELFTSALRISEQNALKNHIASELNNIGLVYYSQGDYVQCLDYYNRSINILHETGDSMKIAQSLLNTGIVYKKQGVYDKATGYLIESAKYFEAIGRYQSLASCYNTLANIQTDLGYFDDAFKYHFKALNIREENGDKKGVAGSLNNIGSVYKSMDSLDLALIYYNKSLQLKNELDDTTLIASTKFNIGEVNFKLKEYETAEDNLMESFMLYKKINDQNGILNVSNRISELYLKTNKHEQAEFYLKTGLQIAKKIKSNELALDNLRLLADYYAKNNDMTTAIHYLYSYDSLKTVILNNEKIKALTELRIQYETEKNEAEITILNEIRESQTERLKVKTSMQYALTFGVAMFLMLFVVAFGAYRQKQKMNIQIKTLMQERQHRAKNNLQIITELLGLQSAYLEHEQAKGAIRSGGNRMQAVSLIDKMLYQNPENTEIEMLEYIQKLAGNLTLMFETGNNKTKVRIGSEPFWLDASKATPLGLILNELITNSFKYAFRDQPAPEIGIELWQNNEKETTLIYHDNGPGLGEGFDIAQTKSLGIKLIHSLSKQLKGTLIIENQGGFFCKLTFKT